MSTEPHPEINGDKSGVVPPQSGRSSGWPKKIGALTAADLDRLTIDNNGRFYWDGKPINYKPTPPQEPESPINYEPTPPQEPESPISDRAAFELLEQAIVEIGHRAAPEPIEGTKPAAPVESHPAQSVNPSVSVEPAAPVEAHSQGSIKSVDHDMALPVAASVAPPSWSAMVAPMEARPAMVAPAAIVSVRLKLSFWQSITLLLMMLSIMIAASAVAANGLVVAYDWGCRVGLIDRFCPPASTPPPIRRELL